MELTFHDCCRAVIKAAEHSQGGNLQFAAAYAYRGLDQTAEFRRVQSLYTLSNLAGWRGDEARAVKAALKEFAK